MIGAIKTFETGNSYSVTRTNADGTFDAGGMYTGATTATFNIAAAVVPVDGRTLQTLPEAYHTEEVLAVFTTTELRAGAPGDIITIDGDEWEVFRVRTFTHPAGTYFHAMVSRLALP